MSRERNGETAFAYTMPTTVLFGRDCVCRYGERLKALGGRALIVTGRSSKTNGSLADLIAALHANGQTYALFDRVTPNPTVACVREGIACLRREGADFLVAVGGGSPMDAAKAIAILAVEKRTDEEIFAGGYGGAALPMAHIPTTAGTGSEVTPYSILTNDRLRTKTSISSSALFPKLAFLDGKYTRSLPPNITVNTAIDAFSHAAESLLSKNAFPLSEAIAEECLRGFYPLLKRTAGALTDEERDGLLYGSMLAGMAIAQTGTTAVHGMGYFLTYDYGIGHGRANGLLLGETLRLAEEKKASAVSKIVAACGENVEQIAETLARLLGKREDIPLSKLEEYSVRAMQNKNIAKSAYEPTEQEVRRIFLRSFR